MGSHFSILGRLADANMDSVLTGVVKRFRSGVLLSNAFSGKVEHVDRGNARLGVCGPEADGPENLRQAGWKTIDCRIGETLQRMEFPANHL